MLGRIADFAAWAAANEVAAIAIAGSR